MRTFSPSRALRLFGAISLGMLVALSPARALPVTFIHDDGTARSVAVAGTFNRWSPTATPLRKDGERWSVTIDLPPGAHEYKFVVNGDRWRPDPRNTATGGISGNSRLVFRTADEAAAHFTRPLVRCVFAIPDRGWREVAVTGEFCGWNDRLYPLVKDAATRTWRGIFYLPASPTDLGVVADGNWQGLARTEDARGFFYYPDDATRWRVRAETRPLETQAEAMAVAAWIEPPAGATIQGDEWTMRAWLNGRAARVIPRGNGAFTVAATGLTPGPNGLRIDAVRAPRDGGRPETAVPAFAGILRDPASAPAPEPFPPPLLPLPTDPDSAGLPGFLRLAPHAADAILYQVMVPRYRDSDGDGIGDLRALTADLPRIADLGVNWIYLLPIFEAPTQHGYHTTDYFTIDRELGTPDDFRAFVEAAHALGLKVMLDYVFNHSSADHPLFRAAYADEASPWRAWHRWRGRDAWAGFGDGRTSMPGWNFDHAAVRRHAIEVGLHWIDAGIDGWRCDVAHGVPDDFWHEWSAALKAHKPDVLLFPEFDEPGFDLYYDGAALEIFPVLEGRKTPQVLDAALEARHRDGQRFPVRYLSYHDRDRLLTAAGGKPDRALLGMVFLLTTPGVPMLYYGEEFGMDGAMSNNTNRDFPPWIAIDSAREGSPERTLAEIHRSLIRLRRDHIALRRGVSHRIDLGDDRLYAYTRSHADERLLVVLNLSDRQSRTTTLPAPGTPLFRLGATPGPDGRTLTLAPLGAAVFRVD